MSDDAHFRLRIPRHLKEWVEERAEANNRSINAEILSCIELAKDGVLVLEDDARVRYRAIAHDVLYPLRAEIEKDIEDMKSEINALRSEIQSRKSL
ncbi:Arc family DNA-binding protein [Novacetimonas hansenii]|uniref:Arc family DNA-binding protein n=1 Tax=Novacetimonas hansenii TaxID=436 RepID=UPI00177D3DE4|nr:Arc family DNA-binding protein [Novacetimonas hansenii]QOF94204.1 Arc family DNA-binding protein [Novacetimonas hansenii]